MMWLGLDARFRDWKLTSPPFVVYVHEKVWKYHAKIGEIWVEHKELHNKRIDYVSEL